MLKLALLAIGGVQTAAGEDPLRLEEQLLTGSVSLSFPSSCSPWLLAQSFLLLLSADNIRLGGKELRLGGEDANICGCFAKGEVVVCRLLLSLDLENSGEMLAE